MIGATSATTTIGTTIAGIRVLRGRPLLEEEEGVCREAGESVGEGEIELGVGVAAKVSGVGPGRVKTMTEAEFVQVANGRPSSELICVLSTKDVRVVVYDATPVSVAVAASDGNTNEGKPAGRSVDACRLQSRCMFAGVSPWR
jgi:hypothetical protein